jgi:Flp pilus assembly protein TadD
MMPEAGKKQSGKWSSTNSILFSVITIWVRGKSGQQILEEGKFRGYINHSIIFIMVTYVYKKMNMDAEASRVMNEVQEIVENSAGEIANDLKLELARSYIINGEKEKGTEIIRHIVQENHDNNEVLDNVLSVFRETGMEDKGQKIIDGAKQEIISLNNAGVKRAQDGKLSEAIAYFEKTASNLPENKIINANAAQVLMLYMK